MEKTIDWDSPLGRLVESLWLDGVKQEAVIVFTRTWLERGVLATGEQPRAGKYRFEDGDFVIERVEGVVTVTWRDPPTAKDLLETTGWDRDAFDG